MGLLLFWIAIGAAALAGYGLTQQFLRHRHHARHRASLSSKASTSQSAQRAGRTSQRKSGGKDGLESALTSEVACDGSMERLLVDFMALTTLRVRMGRGLRLSPQSFAKRESVATMLTRAGLGDVVTAQGYFEARIRLALGIGLVGFAVGFALSDGLGVVLGLVGFGIGWMAPSFIVKGRITRRCDELERHLPEALDVLALGLRGGLSFDRSLKLYTAHFTTGFASGLELAENTWTYGLLTRSEALRTLAATYDSKLFTRVVENIIRSLRFGSSLAESLETTAVEARQTYQATKQEQVAKAPVKIMMPTGALILPAMLILVLGPVLLQLIDSF